MPSLMRNVKYERNSSVVVFKLEKVRAVDITDAIVNSLERMGLSLNELQGQGYDKSIHYERREARCSKKDLRKTTKGPIYSLCWAFS